MSVQIELLGLWFVGFFLLAAAVVMFLFVVITANNKWLVEDMDEAAGVPAPEGSRMDENASERILAAEIENVEHVASTLRRGTIYVQVPKLIGTGSRKPPVFLLHKRKKPHAFKSAMAHNRALGKSHVGLEQLVDVGQKPYDVQVSEMYDVIREKESTQEDNRQSERQGKKIEKPRTSSTCWLPWRKPSTEQSQWKATLSSTKGRTIACKKNTSGKAYSTGT